MVAFKDDYDDRKVNFFKRKKFKEALKLFTDELANESDLTFFQKHELIGKERVRLWELYCSDEKYEETPLTPVKTPMKRSTQEIELVSFKGSSKNKAESNASSPKKKSQEANSKRGSMVGLSSSPFCFQTQGFQATNKLLNSPSEVSPASRKTKIQRLELP